MKRYLLALLVILIMPASSLAKCFLLLEGQHKLSPTVLYQVAAIEMARYIEAIDDTPPAGISENDCVYRLTLSEVDSGFLLVIKGPRLTSYAESDQQGIPGFQQALFRAIIKELPSHQPTICSKHSTLMAKDCTQGTRAAQPIVSSETVYDSKTALTWQKAEAGKMNWESAQTYCESLVLAGYDDWRLPFAPELKSSYQVQFNFPEIEQDYYWSASLTENNRYAWGMTVADGSMFSDWIKNRYFVRCVRGEKLPPETKALEPTPERAHETIPDTKAENTTGKSPVGIRYGIAPTYISGFAAVYDLYKHNMKEQGYSVDDESTGSAIGIAFKPYYQLESGLRIGIDLGPLMAIMFTTSDSKKEASFYALPLNATIGLALKNGLYFKGGLSKLNATGEFVESENLGVIGAVGMEIKRFRILSLGAEAGFDTATVTLTKYDCSDSSNPSNLATCDSETVHNRTLGFTASFLVIF